MAQNPVVTTPGGGDPLNEAFDKINTDIAALYTATEVGGGGDLAAQVEALRDGTGLDPVNLGSTHGTHAYWRVRIDAFPDMGGGHLVSVAEVEMRAIPSGADQCTSGLALSSGDYSGYPASRAFNDNVAGGDHWLSDGAAGTKWLGYQFSEAVQVAEVTVRARSDGDAAYTPTALTVQHSDDGSVWSDAWAVTGQTGWTGGQVRTFTDPAYVDASGTLLARLTALEARVAALEAA